MLLRKVLEEKYTMKTVRANITAYKKTSVPLFLLLSIPHSLLLSLLLSSLLLPLFSYGA